MKWRLCVAVVMLLHPIQGLGFRLKHYDLTGLVYMSTHVVLAERGTQRVIEGRDKVTTYRVLKVYKGSMVSGQEIEVSESGYDLTRMGWSLPRDGEASEQPSWDPETVLFLRPPARGRSGMARLPEDTPLFAIVPSGMRVLSGGKVYRFQQSSIPGSYGPVPQGRDPDDVWEDSRETVDYATFEADLEKVLLRLARLDAALAQPQGAARTSALLDLLGAPKVVRPVPLAMARYYWLADSVASKVYGTFVKEDDIEASLDAFNRSSDRFPWSFPSCNIPESSYLAVALDVTNPTLRRTAALWLIQRQRQDSLFSDLQRFLRLRPLLHEASPEVREAAAWLFGSVVQCYRHRMRSDPPIYGEESLAPLLEALASCWEREADARVETAILQGIRGIEAARACFEGPKALHAAYLMASFETLVPASLYRVRLVRGWLGPKSPRFRDWTLVVTMKGGGEVRRQSILRHEGEPSSRLKREIGFDQTDVERTAVGRRRQAVLDKIASTTRAYSSSEQESRWVFPVYIADPLAPGEYEFHIEVTIDPGEPSRISTPRIEISVEEGLFEE